MTRHRSFLLACAGVALAGACSRPEAAEPPRTVATTPGPAATLSSIPPPGTPTPTSARTAPPTIVTAPPPTLPVSTSTPAPTANGATTIPATTPPSEPDDLAGARVLCAFQGTSVPDELLRRLEDGRAAGVLLFAHNLTSAEQSRSITDAVDAAAERSSAGLPAIVATDQEGGRLARVPGPPSGSAEVLGQLPPEQIRGEATATAENLLTWGINVDLAPVADVARPDTFLDRQDRSFHADPLRASAAVSAFVAGLRDGGVAATLKHFPGMGAADANTDDAVAHVDVDADTWWAVDAPPFVAGVDAGADLVMLSSAVYPGFDTVPAVFSPAIIHGLLRDDLGFEGVTISDALGTPALEPFGTVAEAATRAANAGVDLFIGSDPDVCVDTQAALADAIRSGSLALADAQASYRRIAALRARLA